MINNDSIIVKIDGNIKRVLAKNLPTNTVFGVWNGMRWVPAELDKIRKQPVKVATLDNGLSFNITDDDLYMVGSTIYMNKFDNGNEIGVPMLGAAVGYFLSGGIFDGNSTIYTIENSVIRDAIKEFWEMCGSKVDVNDNQVIVRSKTVQTMIKNYIDMSKTNVRLTDNIFNSSSKFKLGLISGIEVPNDSGKWGRIHKTGVDIDDDIISVIACMGLGIEVTPTDIYYKSNKMIDDGGHTYHTAKIIGISLPASTNSNIYDLKSEDKNLSYMLGNGIIIR